MSLSPCADARTTLGFTCRARLNDWPPTRREGHTSAPCLVQAIVGPPACLAAPGAQLHGAIFPHPFSAQRAEVRLIPTIGGPAPE